MQPDASGSAQAPLRKIRIDPLASFLRTSVDVPIHGKLYEVRFRAADYWLMAFLDEEVNWDAILPDSLSEDDQQEVEDLLMAGELDPKDFMEALLELVTVLAGRKWYVVLKLCRFMYSNWDRMGGYMAQVDPRRMTFAAWLDYAYMMCLEHMDAKHTSSFVDELNRAPEGFEDETDWESEELAFQAAMAHI